MFPFIFEWKWNADHYIFLGFLYLVLIIVGAGLTFAGIKTVLHLMGFLRERHF
jgi:hypothetical protein